ncbi:MAG TPA: hypothetical protein VFF28_08010 [Candidatus Nanoarchaeia archaeon]|nr:hypothetical protein [Candidatus Nanoarchaeia archaeon]
MKAKSLGACILMWIIIATSGCAKISEKEQNCIESGGKVATMTCYCQGVEDFPDVCGSGICTCNPKATKYSKDLKICDCGDGCWDGDKCTTLP